MRREGALVRGSLQRHRYPCSGTDTRAAAPIPVQRHRYQRRLGTTARPATTPTRNPRDHLVKWSPSSVRRALSAWRDSRRETAPRNYRLQAKNRSGELVEVLRQHPAPGRPLVRPLLAPVVHPVGDPLVAKHRRHPPRFADVLPVAFAGREYPPPLPEPVKLRSRQP